MAGQHPRHDPAPRPVAHSPNAGQVSDTGAVYGLSNPDPDMDYAWCPVNRSGPFSVSHMRKAGYEVQRHGDLKYEWTDPLKPPSDGAPIVDDDLVLLARPKALSKDIEENGYRGPGGIRVGGLAVRRRQEEEIKRAQAPHFEGNSTMVGPAGQIYRVERV